MSTVQDNSFSDPSGDTPSITSLHLPNINTAEALARFAGDETRYRHWLAEFIDHGPAAMIQIKEALANGSSETATKLVHALKGRTGMLGMSELHVISRALEMALHNNEPANLWLDELALSVDEMSKHLSAALGKPPQ
ncbi:MAG: Hpt domain-containing protein [Betaproteobacteria bacterium]